MGGRGRARAGCAVLTASALLTLVSCARPALPPTDAVSPDAAPVLDEVTPAPTETVEPQLESVVPPTLLSPEPDQVVGRAQGVEVRVAPAEDGARMGEGLIFIDDGPPKEVNDGARFIHVDDLAPGPHLIRLVPLEDNGLMNLNPDALTVRAFTVSEELILDQNAAAPPAAPAATTPFQLDGPMLTVGQPYGAVEPMDSGEVMIDLRLDNVELGEGAAELIWTVDGDDTVPGGLIAYPPDELLSLGELEPGEHTVTVWLVDAEGEPLENGGLTRVERTFTVTATDSAEAEEEPAKPSSAGAGGTSAPVTEL